MMNRKASASNSDLIASFMEITSSSPEDASFFLESQGWDLDAAVYTFIDSHSGMTPAPGDQIPHRTSGISPSSDSHSSDYSPSLSRSRSRSLSPEQPQARVRYSLRSRGKNIDEGAAPTSKVTLTDLNQLPLDDSDASDDDDLDVNNEGSLSKRGEAAGEGEIGSGLVVDCSMPTTSIQVRLDDGTRMVSRFNLHHTVGDIRRFIEASRPGDRKSYQLHAMEFPPKLLSDPTQTIQDAGIANTVIIQKKKS